MYICIYVCVYIYVYTYICIAIQRVRTQTAALVYCKTEMPKPCGPLLNSWKCSVSHKQMWTPSRCLRKKRCRRHSYPLRYKGNQVKFASDQHPLWTPKSKLSSDPLHNRKRKTPFFFADRKWWEPKRQPWHRGYKGVLSCQKSRMNTTDRAVHLFERAPFFFADTGPKWSGRLVLVSEWI